MNLKILSTCPSSKISIFSIPCCFNFGASELEGLSLVVLIGSKSLDLENPDRIILGIALFVGKIIDGSELN